MPSAAAAHVLTVHRAHGALGPASSSPAKRELRAQGYLVKDQRAYAREKARAAAGSSALRVKAPAAATATPTVARKWGGVADGNVAPSDSTSAVGTTRFIETINDVVAIYDRTHNAPITTDTLQNFWASGSGTTDPQILWDEQTKRFYYAGLDFTTATNNALTIGWSKTASPSNTTTDWCKYNITYGTELPDYPKLGDTKNFLVLGTNTFSNSSNTGTYVGSDIVALGKPPKGKTCPDPSTLAFGFKQAVQNPDGSDAFTPEPVHQTDPAKTGYVIASDGKVPSKALTLFKISADSSGNPVIPTSGSTVKVASYSPPANAPQQGTSDVLDTLDGRLTQAVSAIDPTTGKVAIWTQHTVSGGAGAEVRWYEIDPAHRTLFQNGSVTSGSLFSFNGAISPDRVVNGSTHTGGDSMVLGFDTSSSSTLPAVKVVSKVGSNAQKAPATVVTSSQADTGFDCSPCRWGDYAAATPDPAPTSGTAVWLTSMFAAPSTVFGGSEWSTENFVVNP